MQYILLFVLCFVANVMFFFSDIRDEGAFLGLAKISCRSVFDFLFFGALWLVVERVFLAPRRKKLTEEPKSRVHL